jgi:hypothetical protein
MDFAALPLLSGMMKVGRRLLQLHAIGTSVRVNGSTQVPRVAATSECLSGEEFL